MQTLSDPLRGARDAVRSGRFQDAAVTLAELPPEVRKSAEWYLQLTMADRRYHSALLRTSGGSSASVTAAS